MALVEAVLAVDDSNILMQEDVNTAPPPPTVPAERQNAREEPPYTVPRPRIVGDYSLLRRLGSGGMAEVYVARALGSDAVERRKVAIKRLLPQFAHDTRFIEMLADEASIARSLVHPNIARVHELGSDGLDGYFMAMEYVEGKSVGRVIDRLRRAPQALAAHVTAELARGLEYAHRKTDRHGRELGIVHRDVSPSNVLIAYDGGVKLIDFGIARAESRMVQTMHGVIKGKLRYLAPEIARGEPFDHRVDVFGAGLLLFELLTGEAMYRGRDEAEVAMQARRAQIREPARLVPGLAPELEAIVLRACEPSPADRYPSAGALLEDLEAYLRRHHPSFGQVAVAALMGSLFEREIQRERTLDAMIEQVIEPALQADEMRSWMEDTRRSPRRLTPLPGDPPSNITELAATNGGGSAGGLGRALGAAVDLSEFQLDLSSIEAFINVLTEHTAGKVLPEPRATDVRARSDVILADAEGSERPADAGRRVRTGQGRPPSVPPVSMMDARGLRGRSSAGSAPRAMPDIAIGETMFGAIVEEEPMGRDPEDEQGADGLFTEPPHESAQARTDFPTDLMPQPRRDDAVSAGIHLAHRPGPDEAFERAPGSAASRRSPAARAGAERSPAARAGAERSPAARAGAERSPAARAGAERSPAPRAMPGRSSAPRDKPREPSPPIPSRPDSRAPVPNSHARASSPREAPRPPAPRAASVIVPRPDPDELAKNLCGLRARVEARLVSAMRSARPILARLGALARRRPFVALVSAWRSLERVPHLRTPLFATFAALVLTTAITVALFHETRSARVPGAHSPPPAVEGRDKPAPTGAEASEQPPSRPSAPARPEVAAGGAALAAADPGLGLGAGASEPAEAADDAAKHPATGALRIKTVPPAPFLIDGRVSGKAPATVKLRAGLHQIELYGPEGEVRTVERSVHGGKTVQLVVYW